ncbi:hypothetical protein MKW92_049723, partial [Papaver armeniacum]
YYVRTNKSDHKKILVDDFISNMACNLDCLMIPMNHSEEACHLGTHWTLLLFDFKSEQWKHYNSTTSTTEKCLDDATEMARVLTEIINKKRLVLKKKPMVNNKVMPMPCPQQGSDPDCLLYVCYFMKRYAKPNKQIERDNEKIRRICHDMRYKMVAKMLTRDAHAHAHAKAWNLENDQDYQKWCSVNKTPQH